MKIKILFSDLIQTLPVALRQAGYQLYRQNGSELVFSRRLSRTNFFPRFHMYLHQTDGAWEGNLHYDLRPMVQAHPVHGEEYDGPIVEEEYERIWSILKKGGLSQSSFVAEPTVPVTESGEIKWLIIGVIGIIILIIYFFIHL